MRLQAQSSLHCGAAAAHKGFHLVACLSRRAGVHGQGEAPLAPNNKAWQQPGQFVNILSPCQPWSACNVKWTRGWVPARHSCLRSDRRQEGFQRSDSQRGAFGNGGRLAHIRQSLRIFRQVNIWEAQAKHGTMACTRST